MKISYIFCAPRPRYSFFSFIIHKTTFLRRCSSDISYTSAMSRFLRRIIFFSIQQIHPLLHIFPPLGEISRHRIHFPEKERNDTQKMSFLAAHCGNAVCPPQPYIILYSFQISRLYSAIVLSDEKKPAFAVLMSIFFAHAMRSS